MSEFIEPSYLSDNDEQKQLHLGRYKWAGDHVKGNVVANAACSTNYGHAYLKLPGRLVIGFDRNKTALGIADAFNRYYYIKRDIQTEDFDGFDSLVCLETFEHLENPLAFLDGLSKTVKELVLSVPIIPTKHFNEFHLTDFTEQEIKDILTNAGWTIKDSFYQDEQALTKPTYIIIYAQR